MAFVIVAQFFMGFQHDPRGVAGVLPCRSDIAERHRAGVAAQSPDAYRLGDRRQLGQDVARRHRTLPAADDLQW
jgi:hypothetical protein